MVRRTLVSNGFHTDVLNKNNFPISQACSSPQRVRTCHSGGLELGPGGLFRQSSDNRMQAEHITGSEKERLPLQTLWPKITKNVLEKVLALKEAWQAPTKDLS